jgi:hypothetical protein
MRWLLALLALLLALSATPVRAQTGNAISAPAEGDTVAGIVIIQGTANHPNFLRYELAFRRVAGPGDWIVFAEADQPVRDGTLAVWDTTVGRQVNAAVFPDGVYELRLRVVRQDYNYDEYTVSSVMISNDAATPTPSPESTPASGPRATLAPAATPVQGAPGVLPSLTPFPTPTVPAVPAAAVPEPLQSEAGDDTPTGGLLGQLAEIDWGQFETAFWNGARWAMLVFVAMAAYLVLRWLARAARRRLARRLWNGDRS